MKATPIVATVVHELPVITEITEHTTHATTRNSRGERSSSPNDINVGTTPESIQVVATIAIHTNMGTAGRIWEPLRNNPMIIPRRDITLPANASPAESADAPSNIHGPIPDTESAPETTITPIRVKSKNIRGIHDIKSEGQLRVPKSLFNANFLYYLLNLLQNYKNPPI